MNDTPNDILWNKFILNIGIFILFALTFSITAPSFASKVQWVADYDDNFLASKASSWDPEWIDGDFSSLKISQDPEIGSYLRMKYHKGKVWDGAVRISSKLRNTKVADRSELYLTYWVRFDKDFDFVKGGKLPGFTTFNPGGGIRPVNGFSTRNMWRKNGELVFYLYLPDQPGYRKTEWGVDVKYNFRLTRGKWHKLTQRVRLNTPGKADGIIEGWVDDEKKVSLNNVLFRQSWQTFPIQQFWLSTFFGGNSESWAPKKDMYADFSRFIISNYYPEDSSFKTPKINYPNIKKNK